MQKIWLMAFPGFAQTCANLRVGKGGSQLISSNQDLPFINAMAEICEAAGGDVTVLAKAIGNAPRIGHGDFYRLALVSAVVVCPEDIRAFMARAEELGAQQALESSKEIDSINLRARQRIIELVRKDFS
jgi:UDPglucose 6-dehydrogenase